jgi:hypothetical protein
LDELLHLFFYSRIGKQGHDQGFRGAGVVDVFTDTVLYSEVHGSEDTETLHLESSEMDLMGQNILEVVV